MKILMLAWRDMNHPKHGGAEIVTDIYLKGLQNRNHEVTLFTTKYKNSKDEEDFNGYKIVRKGKGLSTHFRGLIYAKKNEDKFDVIIDQINTIPFFTPLLINKKKRKAFFHQICKNIWFYESKFPISLIGYILEYLYLKLYWNTPTFTVSNSTKNDLIKYSWTSSANIEVFENQIDFKPLKTINTKEDYFIFVGRLTESKRVGDCIKALSNTKNSGLYIIGEGEKGYERKLKTLVSNLGLDKRVIFTGKITNDKRNEIMSKAKAILVTSAREGWGLIVTEANANGTLAITYNVPGLRDANKTGLITKENTPGELSKAMNFISTEDKILIQKSKASLHFARSHSNWNNNIERLEEWLRN